MPTSRPISFHLEMVRAINNGSKTVTRRIVTSQPQPSAHCCVVTAKGEALFFQGTTPESPSCDSKIPTNRYGIVGDRLWVKETYNVVPFLSGCDKPHPTDSSLGIRYRATWERSNSTPWKSGLFMPRWASRLTLEITELKVERLQDIATEYPKIPSDKFTTTEIKAEGFDYLSYAGDDYEDSDFKYDPTEFTSYWNKLNYKRGYG